MTQSKLGAALRRKFSSPQDVIARLGLPRDVLSDVLAMDAAPPPASGGGPDGKLKAMRVEIENLLGQEGGLDLDERQIAKILAVLDKHASFARLDDNDPNAERARSLAGDDDDEEDRIEKFRSRLRQAGLSEDDISTAVDIAKGRGNGRDHAAENAFERGLRGGQLGQDAALARFSKKYPDAMRVRGEPARERPSEGARRLAADAAAKAHSSANEDRLTKKFGENYSRIATW
jgi:hypothetical protein